MGLSYEELRESVDGAVALTIRIYAHLLNLALRARYLVVAIFIAILIFVGAIVYAGVVPFRLFSTDFADAINVKIELPSDYTLDQTSDVATRIEQAIIEALPEDDLAAILTRVGVMFDPANEFLEYGTNLANIVVDIDEESSRCRKPSVIERDLRNLLLQFPELVSGVAKKEEGGPPVGRALNIEIRGPDFVTLKSAAADIETRLTDVPGLINTGNDFPRGKTEYRLRLDEDRVSRAGLDTKTIGRNLLAAFRGLEAARLRWGNDEVTLRVKMDERYSQDPDLVGNLLVKGPRGAVDLASLAEIEYISGISRIKRTDQERVIAVSADIDPRITTSNEVNRLFNEWVPQILASHPGITIELTGESEDTERSLEAMKFAALVAVFLIYALLATITNSFLQPFVIMAVIPFGIVGVVLGLLFTGQPMGLMSIMGSIALAGIVVNNSVVFVDFINRFRRKHLPDDRQDLPTVVLNNEIFLHILVQRPRCWG